MSKIIEALHQRIKPFKPDKPSPQAPPTSPHSPTKSYQMTQKELADVYFGGLGPKTPSLPTPTVIRVIERKRTFIVPWVLTGLVCVTAGALLFSGRRINIDVNILDEGTWRVREARIAGGSGFQALSGLARTAAGEGSLIPTEATDISPLRFRFAGAAVLNSSREKTILTLANSSLSDIAYAAIDFKPPMSLAQHKLVFEARGESGGEKLEIIFRDTRNNSSLNVRRIEPFRSGLSTHWQLAEITIDETATFHRDSIVQMRFEFGSQRTTNPPQMTLFIKNIRSVPVQEV